MQSITFEELFLLHRPRLLCRARHLLGSPHDADDAVQDVYIKLAERYRDRFLAHPNPFGYAVHTLISVVRDRHRRSRKVHYVGEFGPDHETQGATDGGLHRLLDHLVVHDLLARVSPPQARAITLVDLYGHSLDEAADVLGAHRSTVHRNRSRALGRLRGCVASGCESSEAERASV